ncbi:winged helix-turn-helix transcriptional regulator [Sphingobacterium siyangense]|nr:winged helix-turn-helix transcriptional regulator [Sphingobacterium siyangense]
MCQIGRRWKLLILHKLEYGKLRFSEIRNQFTGIIERMLPFGNYFSGFLEISLSNFTSSPNFSIISFTTELENKIFLPYIPFLIAKSPLMEEIIGVEKLSFLIPIISLNHKKS